MNEAQKAAYIANAGCADAVSAARRLRKAAEVSPDPELARVLLAVSAQLEIAALAASAAVSGTTAADIAMRAVGPTR